ncbi:MAG: NAD(P)H-hydrate dehydratase, partial [Thermoplasmata archaeon]
MLEFLDVKVVDENSRWHGTPPEALMESAGIAVARVLLSGKILALQKKADKPFVVVVCGSGNNGGDGLVAARYLKAGGVEPEVWLVTKEMRTPEAKKNLERLIKMNISMEIWAESLQDRFVSSLERCDIVLDSLLGIGVSGSPKPPYNKIVELLNRVSTKVVSIDVPSGFPDAACVKPAATVTFIDVKEGMDEKSCGNIVVEPIVAPPEAITEVGPGDFIFYERNPPDSHKKQNGSVIVIGGGPYYGAPLLAALGAMAAGPDLVRVICPTPIQPAFFNIPEIIVHPVESFEDEKEIERVLKEVRRTVGNAERGRTAAVVGNGIGSSESIIRNIPTIIEALEDIPIVIDADALKALSIVRKDIRDRLSMFFKSRSSNIVLTPHHGEFLALLPEPFKNELKPPLSPYQDSVRQAALALSAEFNAVLLLKGRVDLIAVSESLSPLKKVRYKYNTTGVPEMTAGGTGDVLAGLCAGLLSRGIPPFRAACMAAYLNGKAGEKSAWINKSGCQCMCQSRYKGID